MNFFNNIPNLNPQIQPTNPSPIINNNIFYKINELEQKIKIIEQRIILLENQTNTYKEPDNTLYMI